MAHLGSVRRWEIYWVDLEPSVGGEQVGKRRLLERTGVLEDESIQIDLENRLLEHLGIDFEAEEP